MTEISQKDLPTYRKVVNQISREIETGVRPIDSKLPSERELANQFNISRMTVRAAIKTLIYKGLVTRRYNRGAFIAKPKIRFDLSSSMGLYEQLQKADIKPGAQIIKTEKIPGHMLPQKILSAFGLGKSDEFIRIVRLRTANDRKIAIENSHFPISLFPDLLNFNLKDSIYGILKKYFSMEPVESNQEMEIVPLDIESAAIMEIAPDLSAFEIRRLTMTLDGVTFEYARDIYPGDRVIFLSNSASKEPSSW